MLATSKARKRVFNHWLSSHIYRRYGLLLAILFSTVDIALSAPAIEQPSASRRPSLAARQTAPYTVASYKLRNDSATVTAPHVANQTEIGQSPTNFAPLGGTSEGLPENNVAEDLTQIALSSPQRQGSQGLTPQMLPLGSFISGQLNISVGRPTESIAVTWIYAGNNTPAPRCDFNSSRFNDKSRQAKSLEAIIVLPGYGLSRISMINYAKRLALNRFLVFITDPPGQGESTGDHIGYGPYEARYISELAHDIMHRCDNGERPFIGLLGFSYGAVISLSTNARDSKFDAVVAIAPYTNSESALENKIKLERRIRHNFGTDPTHKNTTDWCGSDLLKTVANTLGHPLDDFEISSMISKSRSPVLIISGINDPFFSLNDVDAAINGNPLITLTRIENIAHEDALFKHEIIGNEIIDWINEITQRSSQ